MTSRCNERDDRRFGLYLLSRGVVTEEQLLDAFDRQADALQPIGKIALKMRKLTVGQVMKILEAQVDNPRFFGELAVDLDLPDLADVNELLEIQCSSRASLEEVLAVVTGLDAADLRAKRSEFETSNV